GAAAAHLLPRAEHRRPAAPAEPDAGRDGQGARDADGTARRDGAPEYGNVGQDAGVDALGLHAPGPWRRRQAGQARAGQAPRLSPRRPRPFLKFSSSPGATAKWTYVPRQS